MSGKQYLKNQLPVLLLQQLYLTGRYALWSCRIDGNLPYDLVPAAAFGRRPVSLSLFRTPETGRRRTADRKADPETIRRLVWTSDCRGSDRLHGCHCLFCSDHICGDFGIYRIWYIDAAVRHNSGNSGAAVDLLFSMHMDTLSAFCCPIILCL